MRKSPFLALPLLALALLTGCSTSAPEPTSAVTGSDSSSATPPDPVPTSTSTSSSTSPTNAATTTPSKDPDAPAGQCADDALKVAVTGGDAGAGSIDYAVTFTNTGGSACTLEGAPGVSVVGKGNGTQLGVPATRPSASSPSVVSLSAGGSASAGLRVVNIGTGGGALGAKCAVTTGDGYRIYPPHSFVAVFVAEKDLPACTSSVSWMTIGAVAKAG